MMTLKNILPVTAVKRDLMKLLTRLENGDSHVIITKDGRASGVLMSSTEYEGLIETLEILADKNLVRQIKKSKKEMASGKSFSHHEVFGT